MIGIKKKHRKEVTFDTAFVVSLENSVQDVITYLNAKELDLSRPEPKQHENRFGQREAYRELRGRLEALVPKESEDS